jgi:hypothetical protein
MCCHISRIPAAQRSLKASSRVGIAGERYGIPIIEDDPYGQLRYEGDHLTPLITLDRQNISGDDGYSTGNVLYLSTFSKTLSPGLRLGWIVAPHEVIVKLVPIQQGADLHTSTFTPMVAYEVARDIFLDEHIKLIRKVYGERRDVMLEALEEYFPPEVSWTRPQGGLFLWVTLPEGMDAHRLFEAALKENVAFVAGDSFYAANGYADEGRRHSPELRMPSRSRFAKASGGFRLRSGTSTPGCSRRRLSANPGPTIGTCRNPRNCVTLSHASSSWFNPDPVPVHGVCHTIVCARKRHRQQHSQARRKMDAILQDASDRYFVIAAGGRLRYHR